LTLNDLYTPF